MTGINSQANSQQSTQLEQTPSPVHFSDLKIKQTNPSPAKCQPLNQDICLEVVHCTYGLKGGKKKQKQNKTKTPKTITCCFKCSNLS